MANFIGRFLYLKYAKGMHWNESIATVMPITQMYDGWSLYPMKPEICGKNRNMRAMKSNDVNPTDINIVE